MLVYRYILNRLNKVTLKCIFVNVIYYMFVGDGPIVPDASSLSRLLLIQLRIVELPDIPYMKPHSDGNRTISLVSIDGRGVQ